MSAMAATGSTEVDEVVPIVATIAIGSSPASRSAAIEAASAPGSISKRSLTGMWTSDARPSPSVMHAFSTEEWASAEA